MILGLSEYLCSVKEQLQLAVSTFCKYWFNSVIMFIVPSLLRRFICKCVVNFVMRCCTKIINRMRDVNVVSPSYIFRRFFGDFE